MNHPTTSPGTPDGSRRPASDDPAIAGALAAGPLRFRRLCLEKVWGGRALEEVLGIRLDVDGPVGETWELVDRADHQSVVAEGPLAGRSLGELVDGAPRALLGRAPTTPGGRFPLLVKFLDASAPLSVQVHPDEEGARAQGGGSEPKTEAWYFLRDGGEVWCGFRAGTDRADFEAAVAAGRGADGLVRHAVRGGDALTVRGGTVHAIGAGVTLLEVQQNSDTTYRLDDWGRVGLDGRPRELHLEQGLEVARFGEPAPSPRRPAGAGRDLLVATEHFELEALELPANGRVDLGTEDRGGARFQVYVGVVGSAILFAPATGPARSGAAALDPGDLLLVPAAVGPHRLEAAGDGARVVRLSVP